ncbi:hypothetical protein NKH77_05055 [Streptomyces sp. M19]
MARWDRALLAARGPAVAALPADRRARGERLFAQARLMVADKAHRLLEYERWADAQESRRLREFGTALATTVDLDGITDALERHAADGGLPGCRLVLFEGAWRSAPPPSGPGPVLPTAAERGGGRPARPPDGFPPGLLLPTRCCRVRAASRWWSSRCTSARSSWVRRVRGGGRRARSATGAVPRAGRPDQRGAQGDPAVRRGTAGQGRRRGGQRVQDPAAGQRHRGVAQSAGGDPAPLGAGPGRDAGAGARRGGRLLRLVDGLLELSRAENDGLELSRRLIDPLPVLAEAFAACSDVREPGRRDAARWTAALPDRLPAVLADRRRLRQLVLNVLTTAAGHAGPEDRVRLTAGFSPTALRVTATVSRAPGGRAPVSWPDGVPDAGAGPPRGGWRCCTGHAHGRPRSAAQPYGRGVAAADAARRADTVLGPRARAAGGALARPGPGDDVVALARRHGLRLCPLAADADADPFAGSGAGRHRPPWCGTPWARRRGSGGWCSGCTTIRRCGHPFLLYGAAGENLARTLRALRPPDLANAVVVLAPAAAVRDRLARATAAALPDRPVRVTADGTGALALIGEENPGLVIVAGPPPDLDAFDVVDRMRVARAMAAARTAARQRGFTAAETRRARAHPALLLLDDGVLTEEETARLLARMARGGARAPGRAAGGAPRAGVLPRALPAPDLPLAGGARGRGERRPPEQAVPPAVRDHDVGLPDPAADPVGRGAAGAQPGQRAEHRPVGGIPRPGLFQPGVPQGHRAVAARFPRVRRAGRRAARGGEGVTAGPVPGDGQRPGSPGCSSASTRFPVNSHHCWRPTAVLLTP